MNALFDLGGRTVVLTGAAGLLGARVTRALVAQGARVAAVDRDPARLEDLAEALEPEFPGVVATYQADITRVEVWHALERAITDRFGPADVLVNAAAAKSANFFEPFETFPRADWDEVMTSNVTSAMLGCQVFGAGMAARGSGSIINFLSIYGLVAPDQRIYEGSEYEGRAINTPAIYSASKAALWGLTKYLAAYWGSRNVRVNAVTPGGVLSGQNDTFVQRYSARVPLGRMADRDEICGAVVYLASPASSYVTGQNLIVDGGLTTW